MRPLTAALTMFALGAFAGTAGAQGLEVAVYTGPAIATYKQTLTYEGSPQVQLARLNVKDSPTLESNGGLSLGGAVTFFLNDTFGLEGRIDSADVDLQSFGGNYTLELGPPGSPVSTLPITLGAGQTDLQRVRPMSFNLRLQSQGRVGVGLSFGVSYMNKIDGTANPTISVANLNAAFPVTLTATPVDPEETKHIGGNVGVTLQVRIAKGFRLVAEARGFAFKKSDLRWQASSQGTLTATQRALIDNIIVQLERPSFTPGFWTARGGLAFRF
jgi:hypothetical protein